MNRTSALSQEPRRIAIFRALYLGDLLCATPAMRAIRERYPSAEITLIGLAWSSELVERLPCIDRFFAFPGFPGLPEMPYDPMETDAFISEARRRKFDLAIQMHGNGTVSNDVVAAMRPTHAVGYGPDGGSRLELALPWREEEHEIDRWLRLARVLGCRDEDRSIEISLTPDDHQRANLLLDDIPRDAGPVVAMHAGARDSRRRWPSERFARLGNELVSGNRARLVLTGTVGERTITDEVKERLSVPVLDLVGRTDLGSFAALLTRCDLLVTNDTGASHLAVATGTRSVVLFGQSEPERWAPLDRECHLMVDAVEQTGGSRSTAISQLPIEPVLAACVEHLSTISSFARGRLPAGAVGVPA